MGVLLVHRPLGEDGKHVCLLQDLPASCTAASFICLPAFDPVIMIALRCHLWAPFLVMQTGPHEASSSLGQHQFDILELSLKLETVIVTHCASNAKQLNKPATTASSRYACS
jgi:hypothetical protein